MNETAFKCAACGKVAMHDFANREPFPEGWFNCQINEQGILNTSNTKPYLLCKLCGHDGNFIGERMTPQLKALFEEQGIHF